MSTTGFRLALEALINSESLENGSDTPDFILADYLVGCLKNFDQTMAARERWYGQSIVSAEPPFPDHPEGGQHG